MIPLDSTLWTILLLCLAMFGYAAVAHSSLWTILLKLLERAEAWSKARKEDQFREDVLGLTRQILMIVERIERASGATRQTICATPYRIRVVTHAFGSRGRPDRSALLSIFVVTLLVLGCSSLLKPVARPAQDPSSKPSAYASSPSARLTELCVAIRQQAGPASPGSQRDYAQESRALLSELGKECGDDSLVGTDEERGRAIYEAFLGPY